MTAPYRKRTPARGAASTLALAIALAGGAALAQGEGPGATTVKIGAQPLDQALTELGAQAGVQIVVVSEDAAGLRARPIEGRFTGEEAVDLLLKDSGLIQRRINDRTIVIGSPERLAGHAQASWLRFAQVDTSARGAAEPATAGDDVADDDETAYETIETIVVTGTNIRGLQNSATPLVQFDREDIEKSGLLSIGDFIQRAVPQNFAAGASEDGFVTSRNDANSNLGAGTGVNLRGLGTDSTLVLLNGRRMAASGAGTFVDVSQIPVTAIERVDVITDGASAIYGSDAVGGVVNFILREDYERGETRIRYSPDFGSDFTEFQVAQTLGGVWESGSALLSYEFGSRTSLDNNDRSLTADSIDPFDLLPDQERHSLFFNGHQDIGERAKLFATVLYTNREATRNTFNDFTVTSERLDSDVEQINVSAGTEIQFSESWRAELSGTFSNADTARFDTDIITGVTEPFRFGSEAQSIIVEGKADGNLFSLPGGEVKAAIGGQYRDLELSQFGSIVIGPYRRDVAAAFGEVYVPIIGESNERPGFHRIELTVAVRYEDYSDFGSSTDPKIGLLYSPVAGLNIRGTWGTSFRAPSLFELDDSNTGIILVDTPNPNAASGFTTIAIPAGGNRDLTAEESDTWTIGFDATPQSIPGLTVGVTYFDISFKKRIDNFQPIEVAFDAFTNPALAPLINQNFDPAELQRLVDIAIGNDSFFDLTFPPSTLADVAAIVDARSLNLAETTVRGLDFAVAYSTDRFGASLDGTWLTTFEDTLTSTSDPLDLLGVVYNPPALRLRAGANAEIVPGVLANLFVNYVDDLTDARQTPTIGIDSWVTVDLIAGFDLGELTNSPLLEGAYFQFSANNLFDDQPPFVEDPIRDSNFDPENHDIIGRKITFGLTYQW